MLSNQNLIIPCRYPFVPPCLRFITPVYHPNIDVAGRICLDLLRLPPKGTWSPVITLSGLLTSLQMLLTQPNPDDPLMTDIVSIQTLLAPKFWLCLVKHKAYSEKTLTVFLAAFLYNPANSWAYILIPWRWRQEVPLKYCYPPTRLHGVTAQKTTIWTVTTRRILDLILKFKFGNYTRN
jgi:hypothetical protein